MAVNTLSTSTDIKPRRNPAHWQSGEQPLGKPITSDNARALARSRWEKSRAKAAAAVAREGLAVDPDALTGSGYTMDDAWAQLIGAEYASLLQMAREGKPRMEQVEILGRTIGATASLDEMQRTAPDNAAVSVSLSAAGLGQLLSLLAGNAGAVDADVVDAGAVRTVAGGE